MDKLIAGAEKLNIALTEEQVGRFHLYYEQLIEWNRRLNLTSIVGCEEVQLKHFLDSLTAATLIEDKSSRILDIGTGAGFPGVPLRIVYPSLRLTLVDSVHKKAAFLDHLIDRLGLDGVEVIAERAERLAHEERYRERFDVVLSRAVAGLATLAELALPFCAVGGMFIAMKKGDIETEVMTADSAIHTLGGRLREERMVELKELEDDRFLIVVDKLSKTPERYPRRTGIPRKRPL